MIQNLLQSKFPPHLFWNCTFPSQLWTVGVTDEIFTYTGEYLTFVINQRENNSSSSPFLDIGNDSAAFAGKLLGRSAKAAIQWEGQLTLPEANSRRVWDGSNIFGILSGSTFAKSVLCTYRLSGSHGESLQSVL